MADNLFKLFFLTLFFPSARSICVASGVAVGTLVVKVSEQNNYVDFGWLFGWIWVGWFIADEKGVGFRVSCSG